MSRQPVPITIGASVFDANGDWIGEVDGITGDTVNVSGQMIPMGAFVRADGTGHHVDLSSEPSFGGAGGTGVPAMSSMDTTATEQELMDRSVDEARSIDPPPPATGTLADPVAGSGFTDRQPTGENLLGDTTVSQPFEDLSELDEQGKDIVDRT